LAIIIMVSEPG